MLLDAGLEVRSLARGSSQEIPNTIVFPGDLTDSASLKEFVRGAEMVVHLGGVAHTTLRTDADRFKAREVNVGGTQKLMDAAREGAVNRVIIASSAHVYAGQTGVDLSETAPTAGDSSYAQMKLDVEASVHAAVAMGMDAVVIRPCIVYGPGVQYNLDSLMRAIRRGYYVHPRGCNPLRSFASVDTVAAAILHLLQAGKMGGIYNIADRQPVHLVKWVDNLADEMRVSRPRVMPMGLLRIAANVLTPFGRMGLPAPLTRESLAKLTASFSLDVTALESTGFTWPATTDCVLKEMIMAAADDRDN